jgi:hypothetical protein
MQTRKPMSVTSCSRDLLHVLCAGTVLVALLKLFSLSLFIWWGRCGADFSPWMIGIG